MEEEPDTDFALPSLNPLIKLFKTSPDHDGAPRWTLHLPVSNQYYQIGWAEFECLARFHQYDTAFALIENINANTTLDIDLDDIKRLVTFLSQNHLLMTHHQDTQAPEIKQQPLWKKLVHGYLYFTVPIFKQTGFLKSTLPIVRPLLSKTFITVMLIVFALMIGLTLQRVDEFTHTFLEMFSVKGAILTFFVFAFIKIVHELAHAYTATKYGVNVPHMGLAFIVMYPILYTETTGTWRLSSAKERIAIGLAGVAAELALATVFLILWHILPPGMGRSISFSVVAISLIGSLFINLNPLMRFDGYFVLSDALGIENLHARAMALTRWKIREILFDLNDPAPDNFTPARQLFMILFGLVILIYRFFLFLGISLLVYFVFFKPLGLVMMILELLWFIALPVFGELKLWWGRRADVFETKRSKISLGVTLALILYFALPLHSNISVSAVLHQAQYRTIYASAPANIDYLKVTDGQRVKEGETLLILTSPALEKDIALAKTKLDTLRVQRRRERTDIALYRESRGRLDDEIAAAVSALDALHKQKDRLIVKAPFDGTIRNLAPEIHENRTISSDELLFIITGEGDQTLTAYIGENQISRIKAGNLAKFYPDFSIVSKNNYTLQSIAPVNAKALSWPELSSIYGGDIPSIHERDAIAPLETLYKVQFKPLKYNDNTALRSKIIQRGHVRIHAKRQSKLIALGQNFIALLVRELTFN